MGDEIDNSLKGFGGNDRLEGRAGNDYLEGSFGDDTLQGDSGNDILDGGEDDPIDGKDIDVASYEQADSAVKVDLANPKANTGEAANDTYKSIEGAIGSNFNDN